MTCTDRAKPQLALENMQLALEHKPGWDLAHRALAGMLMGAGRFEESVEHFEAASAAMPGDANLHNDLGAVYYQLGQAQQAHDAFVKSLEANPEFFRPYLNLANLAFEFGRDQLALERYEKAIKLAPGEVEPCARLARLLATTGVDELHDGTRALALAERAYKLTEGQSPRVLDTLAAAYAATGRFEDALAAATEAEKLALRAGNQQLVSEIRGRVALYATGQPYRVQRAAPPPGPVAPAEEPTTADNPEPSEPASSTQAPASPPR